MADLSNHFKHFSKTISLTKTDRLYLRKARTNITRKLLSYFSHKGLPAIEFKVQGSLTMNTIIRSLHDPFDIDIGLYLKNQGNDPDNWPKTETVSQWIVSALSDHTSFKPINKRKCVRILYRSGNEIAYHVDIPVYIEFNGWLGQQTRIGITGEKQWSDRSDPTGFTKWFFEKCRKYPPDTNQLIRLVQYLKAWKDHNSQQIRFPSGMALTSLMAKNYAPDRRDDIAFQKTIQACYESLDWFLWIDYIESPVQPYNSLTARLTNNSKRFFFNVLGQLASDMKSAISIADNTEALAIAEKNFDYRFQKF